MANGAVYWVGADGNVWFKSNEGVRNVGKPINLYDQGFDTGQISAEARRIADPNPPARPAPAGGGGGGAAPAPKPDRSNSIALQMAGLGAVDDQTSAGLSTIDKALGRLMGQYGEEATANEGNYTTQSNTNRGNLQKNTQTALVNATQGRQGLFSTLASIGALSGTGIDLANRAVQKGANQDISGANENFAGNQTNLDTAIGTFRREDKARKENAETAASNAKTNVRREAAESRQKFYSQLANDYAAMGNAGEAKKYTQKAAALYPEAARNSIPNANIAYSGAAFTPGSLAEYMAGANSTQVEATPAQPGSAPGLIAAPTKKKELEPA